VHVPVYPLMQVASEYCLYHVLYMFHCKCRLTLLLLAHNSEHSAAADWQQTMSGDALRTVQQNSTRGLLNAKHALARAEHTASAAS
jgi:hypothetical protein